VQQGTLRANVCFGRAYDETRFLKVVNACALERDLHQLPGRDMTELGGKVNLLAAFSAGHDKSSAYRLFVSK